MLCNTICTRSPMTTIDKVKAAWDENKARLQAIPHRKDAE